MRIREGKTRDKLFFSVCVATFLIGLGIAAQDEIRLIGTPNLGFVSIGGYVSPTREDAARAGVRGGGRLLDVNGVEFPRDLNWTATPPGARTGLDESNTVHLRRADGEVREVTLRVRPWRYYDLVYTRGAIDVLGVLLFLAGVAAFRLRPFQAGSWALLVLCSVGGGVLTTLFIPIGGSVMNLYFRIVLAVVAVAPLHLSLTFPVDHPLLARRRALLPMLYLVGVSVGLVQWAASARGIGGSAVQTGVIDLGVFLLTTCIFIARCLRLAVHTDDTLIAQRARILLLGVLFGLVPIVLLRFLQITFDVLPVDTRFAVWMVGFFITALIYVTLRQDLLNARVAARRAVIYAAVVGVLTVFAVLLVAVRPYAVAVLLLPLLYAWPSFDARLNAWLYPKRARFPELLRSIGDELAGAPSVDAVLEVLAAAPERLCDARGSVAFLLPAAVDRRLHLRARGVERIGNPATLADEPLVQLLVATRRELQRDHVPLEPQYANIKRESYAGFDRLGAEVVLPMVREQRVIGGLAVGSRVDRDTYQSAEIIALTTVAQQAVQAIGRVEATEQLRRREIEFSDLKRFFTPQVIDQVMARGGAAELRSQRKLVTVFFADLRGFTSFSDSVEPEEVMATLAEYHAAMGRRIADFSGTLEHFAGDGFMVFFNDPVDQPDHTLRAVRMAVAMQRDAAQLRDEWKKRGYDIDVGMGIHTGYAFCGFIGYEGRRDYGVIGNVSNLAARLSDAAAPGEILVTARVRTELNGEFHIEEVGERTFKGFHQAQVVYRVAERDS